MQPFAFQRVGQWLGSVTQRYAIGGHGVHSSVQAR